MTGVATAAQAAGPVARCRSCHAAMPCRCCRVYRGFRNEHGYGRPSLGPPRPQSRGGHKDGRKQVYLHRWVVEQLDGVPLAPGEVVMHLCDNPPCFFYGHLKRGTQTKNLADMWNKGRGTGGGSPGSTNANARLTEDQVRAIRALRGTASSSVVGRQFGVKGSAVRGIWGGKSWRHV